MKVDRLLYYSVGNPLLDYVAAARITALEERLRYHLNSVSE